MDFKRIQIIFLITFVIIDVFLFSLFHRNQSIQTNNLGGNGSANVVSEMRNDQISFRHLPSKAIRTGYYVAAKKTSDLQSRLPRLRNQTPHYVSRHLNSTFRQPIALNSKRPHVTINRLLKRPTFVPFGRQYRYCYDLSTPNSLVYVQKTHANRDDFFSNASEIRFHVMDHVLNGYTQTHVTGIKNLREKSATISARRALTLLYQYNNIPNNTRIEWCHFAYTRLLSVKGNYVYIPTWVIAMMSSDHQIHYRKMNAFSGSIIDNSGSRNQRLQSASK